jgi:hypothetical protein
MCDNGFGRRYRVPHRQQDGLEDLRVSLKRHNVALSHMTRSDGCT